MKKYLQVLISGIASGIFIGIGVSVYLALLTTNKMLGAFLFGFGLYCVIVFNTFLYTGKAGFILDNGPKFLIDLLVGVIGNFIGMGLFCVLMKNTSMGPKLIDAATTVSEAKLSSSYLSTIILSIFCGIMIYIAVVGNKKCENPIGKIIVCFTAVMIFIILGFEHCVANFGYFTYAGVFNRFDTYLRLVVMIIGNGLGSLMIDGLLKIILRLNSDNK